jgi:hypothetical protein
MNWGYKIIVVYTVFITGIVYMVVRSVSQDVDLVTPDYYEQELKYQTTIDATNNANALTAKLKCVVKDDSMQIEFPAEMKNTELKIDVWLYCVANKKKDIKKTFVTNDGMILLPLASDNKGIHEVKVNWEAAGKHYYFVEKLFLQ